MRPTARGALRGFTLVELLVALFVLSLVAVLSWRGLDGMVRAQAITQARADEVLALQVGLAQWRADLDALETLPPLRTLEWNGRVLRLTRRSAGDEGAVVVAWTQRSQGGQGTWLRWQSPVLTTRGQVEQAWARAEAWAQNPGDAERASEVAVLRLDEWQIFYFRTDAWTNPLSNDTRGPRGVVPGTPAVAAATDPQAAPAGLPDGVRLVLSLPAGQPVSGVLTIDWVSPRVAGSRT